MSSPLLNFVIAVGVGLVLGVIGGLALRGRRPNAIWMAPVLATLGALVAAVLALLLGDRRDYGWKEAALQIVLALAGVVLAAVLGSGKAAVQTGTRAS